MSRALVAAPLALEEALIRSGARHSRVRKTGMGPQKSIAAAAMLAGEPGESLFVLGFCGGLDARSRPGEVIVADRVLAAGDEGHTPVQADCDGAASLTRELAEAGLSVRRGPIVGVGKIATGERRRQLLAAGALAVDMESPWLAAGAAGRPFGVVRVVLDSPSHELMRPRALGGALLAARVLRRVSAIVLQDRGMGG